MQLKFSRDIEWVDLPRIESPFFARAHVERAFYAAPYSMDAVAGIDEVIREGLPGHFGPRRDAAALDWLLRRVEDGLVVLVHGHGRRPFQSVLHWEEKPHAFGVPASRAGLSRLHPHLANDKADAGSFAARRSPTQQTPNKEDADPGHWIADSALPGPARWPIEDWLTRGRCDATLNCGKPESSWWDWLVGGAKELANRFLSAQAAAQAEWMAEKGIVQYRDRATGEALPTDAVYERHIAEGRKVLPPSNTGEARGAKTVADHAATGALISATTAAASRGRSVLQHPQRFMDDIATAIKNSRSEAEALGKAGMEKAKDRLGHTTDPRYKDRYHGPDDMTRDKDGKLCEWECKGNKDDSTAVAVDSQGNKQGSGPKNRRRAELMTDRKSKKIDQPSNRQGGSYTQDEIELWKEVEERNGNKMHMSSHTNTETGQVRVYERDSRGNIVQQVDEFKLDNFEALRQGIRTELEKMSSGVSK